MSIPYQPGQSQPDRYDRPTPSQPDRYQYGQPGRRPEYGRPDQYGRPYCRSYHIVRPGDTLGSLANQYGVSVSSIANENPDVTLRRGQRVCIPADGRDGRDGRDRRDERDRRQ
jgi:hypothetical protein